MTNAPCRLAKALDLCGGRMVAFTGGGGKTAALLACAVELAELGRPALASTTTKVGQRIEAAMEVVLTGDLPRGTSLADAVTERLRESGTVFLACRRLEDGKLLGVAPELLDDIRRRIPASALLVEADGSRQRPLKIPGENEPVVPASADTVVPVVGLDAIGKEVGPDWVHRAELLGEATDSVEITPGLVANLLTDERVGLKGVPQECDVIPLLNKAEARLIDTGLETAARVLAKHPVRIKSVLVTSMLGGVCRVVRRR